MPESKAEQSVVIGSGPNGLAAAIVLAEAGLPVKVYEKNKVIGGACRSAELIKPGYRHDIGSAIHPLAVVSPFFQRLHLEEYGLRWITPQFSLAHPFDDGTAVILSKSIAETASMLDDSDVAVYQRLMNPLVKKWPELLMELMMFPRLFHISPAMIKFGWHALSSATGLAESLFKGVRARAVIAGLGVHSVINLERRASAAAGLVLAVAAHTSGWPIPEGGSQKITDALSLYLIKLGGKIITGNEVQSLDNLPACRILMLDLTPRQFLKVAKQQLPALYKQKLASYKYGPGVFKIDWMIDGPVPWKAKECLRAGTVHLGGHLEEIVAAERTVWENQHPEKPFVILAQPSLFDRTRTKGSGHIVWAYCHVPNGSPCDMTGRIEKQIERFAPGFKERIVARHVTYPSDLEEDNPNLIGGDITGGAQGLKRSLFPQISYNTPIPNVFLCSASTPPFPGVHGMCGERSANLALKKLKII
ncbi:MAG: NAD(P)/FAD-dependent oxidoreductase [Dehalococcoidia bacterium]|nr:MAG: NAD(P)/FAD-dependent oxidoreductase [Dehalococcoidia bacterium]